MRKFKQVLGVLTSVLLVFTLVACSNAEQVNGKNKGSKGKITRTSKKVKTKGVGQIRTIFYQTAYQGKKYNKEAQVYLPADFNNNEKHNILYLLHGSTEVRNGQSTLLKDGNFKQLFNKLNNNGRLKNTIVVFPTYYPSAKFVTSNNYQDNTLNRNFGKNELMNDLVPAVESHYRTYSNLKVNSSALQKSRAHRAFGGFSMGSITTWYVFQYDFPYFRYYLPFAGDSWTVTSDGGANAPRRTAQVLANEVRKYPNLKFKIMAGVGSGDGTSGSMEPQIDAMKNLPQFNNNNLQYYVQDGGTHSAPTFNKVINHYATQLFK